MKCLGSLGVGQELVVSLLPCLGVDDPELEVHGPFLFLQGEEVLLEPRVGALLQLGLDVAVTKLGQHRFQRLLLAPLCRIKCSVSA